MMEDMQENLLQTVHKTNRFWFSIQTGLFAGLFWGAAKIAAYYLGFTKVPPAFALEGLIKHALVVNWKGHLLGWGAIVLFSILAAFLYMWLLSKLSGPWIGIAYGIAWYVVLYLLIARWLGWFGPLKRLDWNTLLTDLCLFTVWGVFIGYTISFEFTDERMREPSTKALP